MSNKKYFIGCDTALQEMDFNYVVVGSITNNIFQIHECKTIISPIEFEEVVEKLSKLYIPNEKYWFNKKYTQIHKFEKLIDLVKPRYTFKYRFN